MGAKMHGFYRLAAATPKLTLADVGANVEETFRLYREAAARGAAAVFPALGLSGATCGDILKHPHFLDTLSAAARELACAAGATLLVFGFFLRYRDAVLPVVAVAQNGRVRGFVSGVGEGELEWGGASVPIGRNLIFTSGDDFCFGVEMGTGLLPASPFLALAGARAIFQPAAEPEIPGGRSARCACLCARSARTHSAYVYAGAGPGESTTDAVYSGHGLLLENGRVLAENEPFPREGELLYGDVDFARLGALRLRSDAFQNRKMDAEFRTVLLDAVPVSPDLSFAFNPPHPLVPQPDEADAYCAEVLALQSVGLARRMEHTGAKKLILGVSGGLDSTLALLVALEGCKRLELPASTVLAVQLPGFGTTPRTHNNAETLCRELGVDTMHIDITPGARQHFADLGHDPAVLDVTYENTQARLRTQLLMNLANRHGGLVVGTGDLSELALGWCTYNGDHMSMYAVNATIPKTLLRHLIGFVAGRSAGALRGTLLDILATPVSPELLPPAGDGSIAQATETLLGPYELHDFFLHHFLSYGASAEKMLFLAENAFAGKYTPEMLTACLRTFLRRFFQQQYKRNCLPDGPQATSLSLSPRGAWRMPSDAKPDSFL